MENVEIKEEVKKKVAKKKVGIKEKVFLKQ